MKRNVLLVLLAVMSMMVMAQPPHGGRGHGNPGERGRGHHEQKRIECAAPNQLRMSLEAIENQSFDDKKLQIAELCVTLGHFCTGDLERMARKFSFDANKKKFLTYAYRYVDDPQNYYSLRDVFEFRTNFDEMMDEVHK